MSPAEALSFLLLHLWDRDFCDIWNSAVKMTDRRSHAAIVSIIFTALAFLIVGIRTISRIFLVKRFGLDDGLILAAVCFSIGLSVTIEIRK
jgi:preprotein translocase subunit SecF